MYLIHEFHILSWITEINELFHDILIYWDAPVYIYIRNDIMAIIYTITFFYFLIWLLWYFVILIVLENYNNPGPGLPDLANSFLLV